MQSISINIQKLKTNCHSLLRTRQRGKFYYSPCLINSPDTLLHSKTLKFNNFACFPLLTEVWDGLPGLPYSRVLQACAELCDSTTTQVSKLKHVFGSPQDMQIDFALRTVDTNHLVTQRIRLQDSQRSNQLSVSKTSYPRLDLQ